LTLTVIVAPMVTELTSVNKSKAETRRPRRDTEDTVFPL